MIKIDDFVNEADVHGLQVLIFDGSNIKLSRMRSLIFASFEDRDKFLEKLLERKIKVNFR